MTSRWETAHKLGLWVQIALCRFRRRVRDWQARRQQGNGYGKLRGLRLVVIRVDTGLWDRYIRADAGETRLLLHAMFGKRGPVSMYANGDPLEAGHRCELARLRSGGNSRMARVMAATAGFFDDVGRKRTHGLVPEGRDARRKVLRRSRSQSRRGGKSMKRAGKDGRWRRVGVAMMGS